MYTQFSQFSIAQLCISNINIDSRGHEHEKANTEKTS